MALLLVQYRGLEFTTVTHFCSLDGRFLPLREL